MVGVEIGVTRQEERGMKMSGLKNGMLRVLLACVLVLVLAGSAAADKLILKDGRVIEGSITREGELFVFIEVVTDGVSDEQLHMRDSIARIERDTVEESTPVTSSASVPASPAKQDTPRQVVSENASKIAFITLEGMVGPSMNAAALRESVKKIEDEEPDILVLEIDSGGGFLSEVKPLSDVIEKFLKPKYRVVVWVDSAISAAAMTAITSEEIYFQSKGNLGAATAYSGEGKAVKGEELELILRMMEDISRRGDHNPLVVRAMQIRMDLSSDIDDDGRVTWRDDLNGKYIVSTRDRILTLNAIDAVKYKFARGVADSRNELAEMLGSSEWVEVGQKADKYQQDFRENVQRGEVDTAKVLGLFNMSLSRGQVGQAQRYLGRLRSWARRAPSLVQYGSSERGVPPLTREYFRFLEEQLEQVRKSVAGNKRR
jgi:hypothetical protein